MSRKDRNTPAFISAIRELDDICGLKQQNDNRQAVAITIQAPEQAVEAIKPVIGIEQPSDKKEA
jgi:hypothetical protein